VKLGWVDGNFLAESYQEYATASEAGAAGNCPVWFAMAMDLWLEHAV
jgi:hypothetical protein